MASLQVVPLPVVSAKRRHNAMGLWKIAHYMQYNVQDDPTQGNHRKRPQIDASTLVLLAEFPTTPREVPTGNVRWVHVAGSERSSFSLRTMIMITGVLVLLAAAGTATIICTHPDCRHICSVHAGFRWDWGGLANPSPSKAASGARGTTVWDLCGLANPSLSKAASGARGTTVGAGAVNKRGTTFSTSLMSPRNPNAVEASLYAGGFPSQQGIRPASDEASSSADDSNTWQVVHNSFLKVRNDSCLNCKVIGTKDRCIMVHGHREGDWIRLLYEPGYMLAVANGRALLEKSEVSYSRIPRGTCAEHGLYPITDDISCEAAALAVGFPDLAVQVMHDAANHEGCYTLGFKLWMNRQPLCSSNPTPIADACQKRAKLNPSSPWPAAPTQKQKHSSHSGRHTLFCFSLIQPDTYELKLMTVQMENSASIFRCDGSAVLSVGRELKVGPRWRTIPVPISSAPQKIRAGASSLTAKIRMTYIRAWDLLLEKGTLWSYTWTAKVDSSAVFFPNRLLKRLESFLPINEPVEHLFTQSCDSRQGPSDAVAIYSREALRSYQSGNARCRSELTWHKWSNAYFMQKCFQMLGLNSTQDTEATKSIFGTGTCHPSSCRDRSQVSFNGFKKASTYMACFEQATEEIMEGLWKIDTVEA